MSDEITPTPTRPTSLPAVIQRNAMLLFGMLGLMWAIEIIGLLPRIDLRQYGIHPRTLHGLWGILFAPFLHVDPYHLIANSVPFIVLGGVVLLGGRHLFWAVTILVILLGGFGVWLLAPGHTLHIGASGLIFGYLGFLLARGVVERSVVWFLVSLFILVGYGGLLWGMLPLHPGVSWQSHLFGFLAGLAAARLLVAPRKKVIPTDLGEPEIQPRLE